MSDKCAGPECPRPVQAKGLCWAHYIQQRRHPGGLKPIRIVQAETAQVSFRCSAELKAAVARAAKLNRVEPSEVWRLAADHYLAMFPTIKRK